jgi:hypothetical protein
MICTIRICTRIESQAHIPIGMKPDLGCSVNYDCRLTSRFHGSFITGTASTLGRCDCLAIKRKAKKGPKKKAKRTGKKKTKPKKKAPKPAPMMAPKPMPEPEVQPPAMPEVQPTTETPPTPEPTQPSTSQSEPTPSQ